ncbi:glycosyltransferase [Acetobacteraceae bacterium H6797]|nr:glycosyltransferase [Acetobacteraceae bacterium H6797]
MASDPSTDDPRALLAEANACRDRRDWLGAAQAYGAYLALRPQDAGILIQRGHCLKEAGDRLQALSLYEQASQVMPLDFDVHLQRGHALKLLGRLAEAEDAYSRAVSLAWDNPLPWSEYAFLAHRSIAGRAEAPALRKDGIAPVAVDISDLIAWARGRRRPSGIQRVQLGVIEAALRQKVSPLMVAMLPQQMEWHRVPLALAARLMYLMRIDGLETEPAWREVVSLIEGSMASAPPVVFPQGQVLFDPGTAWSRPNHAAALRQARRASGLRYVPLLHDCGPLVQPEMTSRAMVNNFAHWLANAAFLADGMIANSRATQADLKEIAARHLPGMMPRTPVIQLAAMDSTREPGRSPLPRSVRGFVLCVGSMEPRKNHLMLFSAWATLIRRHGRAAIPPLVVAGRQPPEAAAALAFRENVPGLASSILLFPDLPDPQLRALYADCLFTVYNSSHEGWGLPVTESLAFGKVPVIPSHSALLEAGEAAGVFFNPGDERSLVETLEKMIFEVDFLAEAEKRLAEAPPPRSWLAVGHDLLSAAAAVPPRETPRPPLRLGHRYPIRRIAAAVPMPEMAAAELVRAPGDWFALEENGSLSRREIARLQISTPADEGPLLLHLELAAPLDQTVEVTLRDARSLSTPPRASVLLPGESAVATLPLAAGRAEALVEIELSGQGDGKGGKSGPPAVWLRGLMLCAMTDIASRVEYLENRLFRRLLPADELDPLVG